jgi:holo-[acyl-carrier protein] synthase
VIVGIGVDLCEVARIREALEATTGPRFRARVFTEAEQAYCDARRKGRFASYAARFAAKEAAMKALGTGWAEGVGWRDVEVVHVAGRRPVLALHGRAAELARAQRIGRWHVALSHTRDTAAASVVAEDGVTAAGRGRAVRRRVAAAGSGRRRPRGRR